MWNITSELCSHIPKSKANCVVCTLTDYNRNIHMDQAMLNILSRSYNQVFLWPQGIEDSEYFQNMRMSDNIEIILVDDGSPDNCPKICDEWASKDKRIKVVHKKNGGLSSARNAGLAIANGDYIGFVDSDDFINETMYEDLMQIMLSNKKNIVVSSPIIRNIDGKFSPYVVGSFVYKNGDSMLIKDYMEKFLSLAIDATVWNKLFRRDFIKTS